MTKNKIVLIAGARPNFMKVAPLCWEVEKRKVPYILINTGQHFSPNMAGDFFKEFSINPDYEFSPSRDSTVKQLADIMLELERVFEKEKPSVVVVFGDVNSTLAGALVANKMNIPLVHVEAGLRSSNRAMPEEHNRIVTDNLADLLLATSQDGIDNMNKENITADSAMVGNVMIDTLAHFAPQVESKDEPYYFVTLHRAENVDNQEVFSEILDACEVIAQDAKMILPLHPRTEKMAEQHGLLDRIKAIFTVVEPLTYQESVAYQKSAKMVLTDSGGIQEETSFLEVPCVTLRSETERPVTVSHGTNVIGGVNKDSILVAYRSQKENPKTINSIELWDGKTSERILDKILDHIN